MNSRQSHIWSHRISIQFQLYKGSRLNLQEADGKYERRKWLRGSTSEHRGSTGEHWESTSEHRESMREQWESIREQRGSMSTKRALSGEQSGGTLVSDRSRVDLGSGKLCIYIYHSRNSPICN